MRKVRLFLLVCVLGLAWLSMGCRSNSQVREPDPGPAQPDPGPPAQAPSASTMTISGFLRYRRGRGKRFSWRLRFYENTGLVLGSGRDRDGYAEFFGIYNARTRRFAMVKFFKYRRSRPRMFFYRGLIRNGRLAGSAHSGGFRGRMYASWRAGVAFQRLKFDQGRSKRFVLKGFLRYRRGGGKRFLWAFRYYPSSGSCFGLVSDRDGRATFSGVYDRPTNRFFLRKRYANGRTFYYIGRMTRRGAVGNARRHSFISSSVYGTWQAVMIRRR